MNYTVVAISALFAMFAPLFTTMVAADDPLNSNASNPKRGRRTLGGTQHWTDLLICNDWRIQRNVSIGQCRLLKPTNRVAVGGSYSDCRAAFLQIRKQVDFLPIPANVLITAHGLGRTRNSMAKLGKQVSQQAKWGWVNFGYASTRTEIPQHASALRNVLDELASLKQEQDKRQSETKTPGIQFHFVAHSLGNIVIREVLHNAVHELDKTKRPVWQSGRMVMLGPPNNGSAMATLLKHSKTFRLIAGDSGQQLGPDWKAYEKRLSVPNIEFAIIAGGKCNNRGYNPLLEGDDDMIVRVEETKLPGARDFVVIPALHTYLMTDKRAIDYTARFLQAGYFKSESDRRPIATKPPPR